MIQATTRIEKIKKITALVNENPKVDFDPETTTFYLIPCNCKIMTDFDKQELSTIIYTVNSYILEKNYKNNYNIDFLGNFGVFIICKIQELTQDNPKISVLTNSDVDLLDGAITIKIDLFKPFKTILEHINLTIADVEKTRRVKIGSIKYLEAGSSVKHKTTNGKRRKTEGN